MNGPEVIGAARNDGNGARRGGMMWESFRGEPVSGGSWWFWRRLWEIKRLSGSAGRTVYGYLRRGGFWNTLCVRLTHNSVSFWFSH